MKISACSIVKNEAQNIKRSIESYREAVDEIIIVDTGSTDDTVAICEDLGAKVLTFEWCNDFAAAKNYALKHAKGDWVIFLDADEWFVPNLKRSFLLNVLSKVHKKEDVVVTTMCEYDFSLEKIRHRNTVTRIFRNTNEIRYRGSIHEDIVHSKRTMLLHVRTDIEIYHSGYQDQLIEAKSRRNLEILNSVYSEGKEISTELYFYLFRENSKNGNTDEAIKFYNLFIKQRDVELVIKNRTNMISVYEIMYVLMAKNRDRFTQEQVNSLIEMAFKKYPQFPVHAYMLGAEKLRLCEYEESYKWLNKAIEINRNYSLPYINKFVGALADTYYKLGYIRQKQGKSDDALTHYLEAVKVANKWELELVLQQIINIIEAQPQEEIILFINSIIDIARKENIECILNILKKTKLHKVFIYYAIKYNQEFDGQDETTYLAMMITNQEQLAIDTALAASKNVEPENDWHTNFAVIAILFSNSIAMFCKYEDSFCEEHKMIIRAFLNNGKVNKKTDELISKYISIRIKMYNILDDNGFLDRYDNIL